MRPLITLGDVVGMLSNVVSIAVNGISYGAVYITSGLFAVGIWERLFHVESVKLLLLAFFTGLLQLTCALALVWLIVQAVWRAALNIRYAPS